MRTGRPKPRNSAGRIVHATCSDAPPSESSFDDLGVVDVIQLEKLSRFLDVRELVPKRPYDVERTILDVVRRRPLLHRDFDQIINRRIRSEAANSRVAAKDESSDPRILEYG